MADEGDQLLLGVVNEAYCVFLVEVESQLLVVAVASLSVDPASVVHYVAAVAAASVQSGVPSGCYALLVAEADGQPVQSVDLQQEDSVPF